MPLFKKIILTPQHKSRIRLFISVAGFVAVASGFSAYAAHSFHSNLGAISDPIAPQLIDSTKAAKSLPATHKLPDEPTAVVPTANSSAPTATVRSTASSNPTSVVTPAPTSVVPSLTPTSPSSSTAPSTTTTTTTSTATTPAASPTTIAYQSTNWAGYLTTGSKYTSVAASWIAPSPSATSTSVESADGTWIGIGGVTSSDLIQVGTENTISASGVVTTAGFYELLPAGAQSTPSLNVQPGNRMSASITQTAPTQWTISMTNLTTGQTFSKSVAYSSSFSSAEWIQEDPSYQDKSLVLLDNFGTAQFSGATTTADGVTVSASAIGASPITLIGQGGASGHGAKPGALSGGSFVVSYY